jgi:cobalt-zinc-cadmium efflux system membrane fusion protein
MQINKRQKTVAISLSRSGRLGLNPPLGRFTPLRFALLIALMFALSSCTGTSESPEKGKTSEQEKKAQVYLVTLQDVSSYLEATGSIQPDVLGSAKIMTPLSGVIENIYVKVGDRVGKGDSLVAIRSPEVSDAYSNYMANLSQLRQAERVYGLNKQLFEVGAVTKNDLLTSEANYEQVKALSHALKRKLEIYGVNSESGFSDRVTIKSPMDGAVVEIQGHVGDRMDTTNPILTVADPARVMVVANIYDTDIAHIQKGKEVQFYTDIFEKMQFRGVVTYISDASDLDTKTVKTYIRILSGQNLFKQNMFLRIKIMETNRKLPVVPKTALLYKDGKFDVYVKVGEEYQLREVKPAIEVSEKMIAVDGLKEGDEILLSAIEREKT